jgi:hypothetical protein
VNDTLLLEHLEEIAHRLGVRLRYENLGANGFRCEGGLCRVNGKSMILINRKDPHRRKITILAGALNRLDLEGIFIPPAVRKALEDQAN